MMKNLSDTSTTIQANNNNFTKIKQEFQSIEIQKASPQNEKGLAYQVFHRPSLNNRDISQKQQTQNDKAANALFASDSPLTGVIVIGSIFLFITLFLTGAVLVFCKKKNTVFVFQKSEQEEYEDDDEDFPSFDDEETISCSSMTYHHKESRSMNYISEFEKSFFQPLLYRNQHYNQELPAEKETTLCSTTDSPRITKCNEQKSRFLGNQSAQPPVLLKSEVTCKQKNYIANKNALRDLASIKVEVHRDNNERKVTVMPTSGKIDEQDDKPNNKSRQSFELEPFLIKDERRGHNDKQLDTEKTEFS